MRHDTGATRCSDFVALLPTALRDPTNHTLVGIGRSTPIFERLLNMCHSGAAELVLMGSILQRMTEKGNVVALTPCQVVVRRQESIQLWRKRLATVEIIANETDFRHSARRK